MPTFAEYLEKWLKQSTAQGLTNPLVKMPVKRFRRLQQSEFDSLASGRTLIVGTMADPIARNLHKNYQTRIRERGEHCAFVCAGAVEMIVAGAADGKQRKQLFPVCLKRATFQTSGDASSGVAGSSGVISSSGYSYNAASQRTGLTNEHGGWWVYQYDALGQVISGKKYWPDGTPVAGQQFTYGFDDIGNRQSAGAGGDQTGSNLRTANYSANLLNQYTQRTVPGAVDIIGSANSNATVTVNMQRPYRKGDYFWEQMGLNNGAGPVWRGVTNLAVLNQGTNADLARTNMGHVFLAQTPESYSYDADGNLLSDGRWTYAWDGENRLLGMTSLSNAPGGSKMQLGFSYDYQGRRIAKVVSTNNGSAYVGESTNYYVHDGWNCVAICNPSLALLDSFLWGSDLSGNPQRAGGVGGLISMTVYGGTNAGTYFYSYDGNGNATALVNATNGATVAHYEYGPFGEVIRATGPMAKLNPFRFSTKYDDDESDFLCFGYRFYNPSTGRWLSRDPAEEEGGLNLYAACQNDCVGGSDLLGLWTIQRSNRNRADAIPSPGDTVQSLAIMIKLDDSDYTQWLRPVGPTSMPASATTPINSCAEFTIPNTMYIEFGRMTSWIDRFGPIPPWREFLVQEQIKYEIQGFNVVLRNPSDPGTARNDLQDPNIYEFAYAGHGGGSGALVFSAGEGETTLAPARITPFGIASFVALACDTASQTPVSNPGALGYEYSEWEKNVATRGLFVGVWGVVNGYQAWSHLIITPGTNTR